jgi:hypothetical protein
MTNEVERVICPICGAETELGAVYSRSGLYWMSGGPDLKKKLQAEFMFGGEGIGEVGLFWASHVSGIFCRKCHRIVLDVPSPRKYFPDLRE